MSGRKNEKDRRTKKEAERRRKKACVIWEMGTQRPRIKTPKLPTITSMPCTERGRHTHTLYLISYWNRNLPSSSLCTERNFDTLLLPCFIQHKCRKKKMLLSVSVCVCVCVCIVKKYACCVFCYQVREAESTHITNTLTLICTQGFGLLKCEPNCPITLIHACCCGKRKWFLPFCLKAHHLGTHTHTHTHTHTRTHTNIT